MAKKLTDAELTTRLQKNMNRCPICKSDDLITSDLDGNMSLNLQATCDSCGATWRERYQFVSASDLEEGTKK